jgi:hypothetical protein
MAFSSLSGTLLISAAARAPVGTSTDLENSAVAKSDFVRSPLFDPQLLNAQLSQIPHTTDEFLRSLVRKI